MKDNSCRVYFAKCIGPDGKEMGAYKIGRSYGHNDRVKAVCSNLPFTLEVEAAVPGDFVLETVCHLKFRADCLGGEYFRATDKITEFVRSAAITGDAFHRITDKGDCSALSGEGWDIFSGFLHFHDLTFEDACEAGGLSSPYYRNAFANGMKPVRKMIASAALAAYGAGRYVTWPDDGYRGCLGDVSCLVAGNRLEAAQ